jgi:hypothetical protein
MDGYDFVAHPNRDSVPSRGFYRIPEAHTVIRGSLRYKGDPAFVQALANLGWLEQDKNGWLKDGMTWAQIHRIAINALGTDEEYDSLLQYDIHALTSERIPYLAHTRGRSVYRQSRE